MPISDKDPINHRELARILGITAAAALRGGKFSAAQQRRIDRIVEDAKAREAKRAK
ncbi:hypothetical protein [Streptomyces apocyni]|uniref:hypothetical protein n=1 Tax=Streptomyces apocyni TaxID=2654677 RepID=UPI0012EAA58B|nr:hypothetical protein [Streptomyces apocyni]